MGGGLRFWFKYLSFTICSVFLLRIKITSFNTYFINYSCFFFI